MAGYSLGLTRRQAGSIDTPKQITVRAERYHKKMLEARELTAPTTDGSAACPANAIFQQTFRHRDEEGISCERHPSLLARELREPGLQLQWKELRNHNTRDRSRNAGYRQK